LVEQRIENPRVGGSNPPPGTTPIVASADPRFRAAFAQITIKMSFFARPDWVITVALAHQAKRRLAPLTL